MSPAARIEPGPGQESVWDYPRPPAVEPSDRAVRVEHGGELVAETHAAIRVLETAGAPVWYLPRDDVRMDLLRPVAEKTTHCEWKGSATYFDLVVGDHVARNAARLKSQHARSVSAEAPDTIARSNSGDGHAHTSETNHMDGGGFDRHRLRTDVRHRAVASCGTAGRGLTRSRRRSSRRPQ